MKESDFKQHTILIAGLGLIGGSVAKAFKKAGYSRLFAFDSDPDTIRQAQKDGTIEAGFAHFSDDLPVFDLVVCCLSPCFVVPLYQDAKPHMKERSVFAELGGLKTVMIDHLTHAMEKGHQLLSLHPMAGSEKAGYAHSDAQLFEDSLLILTPTKNTGEEALAWGGIFKQALRCADMRTLDAGLHDEIIANVSHIPHIAALAIKAMNQGTENEQYAGGSYRAITRVADINSDLWAGLFADNREYLLKSIALLKENISILEQAIEKGNVAALKKLLDDISNK